MSLITKVPKPTPNTAYTRLNADRPMLRTSSKPSARQQPRLMTRYT
jgi:hypothetical protein